MHPSITTTGFQGMMQSSSLWFSLKRHAFPNVLFVAVAIILSCQPHQPTPKPRSIGMPGEILLVVNKSFCCEDSLKDLRGILESEFPALPQPEVMFRTMMIPSERFRDEYLRFRNILILSVDPSSHHPVIRYSTNKWAINQSIVEIRCADFELAHSIIQNERTALLQSYYQNDLKGMIHANTKNCNQQLFEKIESKFGLSIMIPMGYRIKKETSHFIWLQLDKHDSSLGIMIYDTLCPEIAPLDTALLLNFKRKTLKEMIHGVKRNSYMMIEPRYPMQSKSIQLNGINWTEVRGLWSMHHDFMGGPFLSLFTTHHKRMLVLDAFMYAPGDHQKSLKMRTLESILKSSEIQLPNSCPMLKNGN